MEISNELRERIFGTYWDVNVKWKAHTYTAVEARNVLTACRYKNCQPILMPLSEITDEHAIGVAKRATINPYPIGGNWKKDNFTDISIRRESDGGINGVLIDISNNTREYTVVVRSDGLIGATENGELMPIINMIGVIDYLRKWYDMGFEEITSLIDAGIAISSLDLK